jgi:O-acetyl-ADP-ribose deacetylase (regulator of RNase III)
MDEIKNKIEIVEGDITTINVDAIVNAANNSLLGGGGVDGAIHEAGGEEIFNECLEIFETQGGCATGEAVVTTAGKLPAKVLIHTVGPVWKYGNDDEAAKLENCYKNSLKLAVDNNCKTIAFPSISIGVYNYPKDQAANIAVNAVADFLKTNNDLEKVILVSYYDKENFELLKKEREKITG